MHIEVLPQQDSASASSSDSCMAECGLPLQDGMVGGVLPSLPSALLLPIPLSLQGLPLSPVLVGLPESLSPRRLHGHSSLKLVLRNLQKPDPSPPANPLRAAVLRGRPRSSQLPSCLPLDKALAPDM